MPGDGVDNDCDGRIDEEVKDGKDDDGDRVIDEDLQLVNRIYILNKHSSFFLGWFRTVHKCPNTFLHAQYSQIFTPFIIVPLR